MNYYYYKLISPRPTFPADMTDIEGGIMQQHVEYWLSLMKQNKVVVFGPVIDPARVFGIAVIEAEDDITARDMAANDPAIKSNVGFSFEVHSMPKAIAR